MEKPRLRGRRGGRRRMDEIRGERRVGGGTPCCGSRQSVCWTARACARVALGLWVWLLYSWKQARNFDWNPTGFCLIPAGPPGRYFSTNYSSNYILKIPGLACSVQLLARPGEPASQLLQQHTLPKPNSGVAWN